MEISNFFLLFVAAGLGLVVAQKDSSENDDPSKENTDNRDSGKPVKTPENSHRRYPKPEFLITPDERVTIDKRLPHSDDEDPPRQNVYLSDDTGRYQVQVQNFQGNPTRFQATLGAISAHILNQRTNQEYVPYPPNGDPYNYPAYRGHLHATEPPVVRAYERASSRNYGVQSDFDQFDPRRVLSNDDHQRAFPNQFESFRQSFYTDPNFFNGGEFYEGLRRTSEPIREDRWYREQGEEYGAPRYA